MGEPTPGIERLRYSGFLQTPLIGPVAAIPNVYRWDFSESAANSDLPAIPENLVFGKRMEQYLTHALQGAHRYRLMAHGLQIQENQTTLGELDFILADDEKQELLHLELTYKLYCYDPSIDDEKARWIGPNRKDRLIDKLDKLTHRQFPLLFESATQQALEPLDLPNWPWRQVCCFKAQLFLPEEAPAALPADINPEAVSGTWLRKRHLEQMRDVLCIIPPKENWTIAPQPNAAWKPLETELTTLTAWRQKQRAPLCWLRRPDGRMTRHFVVWW